MHADKAGVATLVAFVAAGSAPLLAYLLPVPPGDRFAAATVLALVTQFAVGTARTAVVRGRWWRNGLEMLLVGAFAAGVATPSARSSPG